MAKIIHLITSVQIGGAEMIAFNLAEYSTFGQSEKFDFILVEIYRTRSTYSFEKRKELLSKNIKIITLSKGSKRFSLLVAPFRLVYFLLKIKPDIVHSHTDLPDFVLSVTLRFLALFKLKSPRIVRTIQNTKLWPTHHKIGKFTEKAFVGDTVVGVSKVSLDAYRGLRVQNNLPLSSYQYIIYNCCVTPEKKQHTFKISKQKINIAFCGRFEHQKGIDILIERIEKVNIKLPNTFFFHIIGNGSYLQEVQKLSKKNTNVLIYDAINNFADKLYPFDFIIMPSRYEGLVLTSIEASLSKVLIIAANAPGLSETLPPNWPLQFDLDNEEELLSILSKIKSNEFDLETLRLDAYKFVSQNFSFPKMIASYSELYKEINE